MPDLSPVSKTLTILELQWSCRSTDSNVSKCTEFFTHLGSSCPKLKKLKLNGVCSNKFPFGFEQKLAFILGEAVKLIPYDVMEELRNGILKLHCLQFDSKDITPICSTLQSLDVNARYRGDDVFDHISVVSAIAFLLRHLPFLEKLVVKLHLYGGHSCGEAVRLLQSTLDLHEDGRETSDVIEMTRRVNGKFLRLKWTTNCPPASKNFSVVVLF